MINYQLLLIAFSHDSPFRSREINPSPNSTPGLVTTGGGHPGPAQSPPTPGGGETERGSWAQQQQFRLQQQEKSLEGQMKQQGGNSFKCNCD